MKVIFLDNDGVICLANNWGSRLKKQKKVYTKNNPRPMNKEIPFDLRFDNFDQKAVKVLNKILKESDAEIVVSSDWRFHATLDELGDYYESQGITKRPIGLTERYHYTFWKEEGFIPEDFGFSRTFDLEQERHFEIKRWLRDHPEVTHWVAVDDLNMGIEINTSYGPTERDWGLENFVWTPRDWEGIKQSGVKDKIIKFLR
jgi:hypothetical protein